MRGARGATTEVAFLRAVNVGGRGTLKMADLARLFEAAGCRDVRTYIQSGNVIFRPGAGQTHRAKAAKALAALLGKEVAIAWRTLRELQATRVAHPFGALTGDPDVKLYVGYLAAQPGKTPKLPLALPKEGLEILGAAKRDVFIVSRKVKGSYGFPNALVERAFGVPATTRNWNTVTKVLALAGEADET